MRSLLFVLVVATQCYKVCAMEEFVLIGKMKARPHCEEKLEQVLKSLSTGTYTEPGCLRYALHRDSKDASIFVLIEAWESPDALQAHFSAPHFRDCFPLIQSLIEGEPHLTYLCPLSEGAKGSLISRLDVGRVIDRGTMVCGYDVDKINCDFYNNFADSFDKIPFESTLPGLLLKYGIGHKVLEIGSGAGALALWLTEHGYEVTCLEPAQELAAKAALKGVQVQAITIQNFHETHCYDMIVAISSLIHVPKIDLPSQIEKIANLLGPEGIFLVSFIEGDSEGLEDPTMLGMERYFSQWTALELDCLLSPHFHLLESNSIFNKRMNRLFLLRVYSKKDPAKGTNSSL